ncbi:hypothetical protein CMUS01_00920 [Colletotrichum musicola]|uniref:Uncharacterized protein n=1 Tax=Colletotrichum musicola TaxID=2175873 RepID=A0A8H6NXV8_9PEZI|nr:hypothetical protein CMUS01_00920 [Colletotrichum musicola]
MILPGTPGEDTKGPSPSHPSAAKGCTTALQLPADRDFHATPSTTQATTAVPAPAQAPTDSPHALAANELPVTPPEFPDLTLPDYIESGLHDFEIQELLEADLALSDQSAREFALDDTFASSTSPEDKAETRESSFASSIATSSEIEWELAQQTNHRKRPRSRSPQMFVPAKRASTSMTSHTLGPPAPLVHNPEPKTSNADSPIATDVRQPRQLRELSSPRHAVRTKASSPCRCIGVTLTHLERIQGQSKVTSICIAEKSLHSLKRSIFQCETLLQCQSCRSPSRVMTFLILLVEKMVAILEDISSTWESSSLASASDRNSAQTDMMGRAHHWLPIHLGQYQIDTVQERCEVFGYLILLQVRHFGAFLDSLRSQAERQSWESHQNALRPVSLRVRDLQEALVEMTSGLGR